MRWTAWVACVPLLAGCGDRLSQGDRVILVNPASDKVWVTDMEEHEMTGWRWGLASIEGKSKLTTEEPVPAGIRATVVRDEPEKSGDERKVKVNLLDPPFAGQAGSVERRYLKRE